MAFHPVRMSMTLSVPCLRLELVRRSDHATPAKVALP